MLGFLFFLCSVACRSKSKLILETEMSLFGPPVGYNGRSSRYNFLGDYAVTSYTAEGSSYTQLGYDSINSSEATLVSKKAIGSKSYRVDYKITLRNSEITKKRNGVIAFFLARESSLKEDKAFSIQDGFDGTLVVLSLKGDNGRPFISGVSKQEIKYNGKIMEHDTSKKVYVNEAILQSDFVISLELQDDMLSVFFGNMKDMYPPEKAREHAKVLSIRSPNLSKDSHIGVASLQQGGSLIVRLQGIRFYTLIPGPKILYRNEVPKRKRSKFIWFILFLIACGIGYYLFKNYKRYK